VTINPDEAVDVLLIASGAGTRLGRTERTYIAPGRHAVTIKVPKPAARALEKRVEELRADGRRKLKVKLAAKLTDAAGNGAKPTSSRGLLIAARRSP
jgi:hypothetical protein